MVRRLLSLFFTALVSTIALRAEATPALRIAVRLDYQPPDSSDVCPTSDELGFMLAAEFGYPIIRDNARGVLTVLVRVIDGKYQAELTAPNASGAAEDWRWRTDKQPTCRELAYDLATVVRIALGPSAWTNGEPPETLAAPPPVIELRTSAVLREQPRILARYLSMPPRTNAEPTPVTNAETPMQVEAALGPAVTLYGLPSVAIGGSGLLAVRWTKFALGMDIRGVITPIEGIGERDVPGRTTAWTGSILPCVVIPYLDMCGVLGVSQLNINTGGSYDVTGSDAFSVGLGTRLNGRLQLSRRFTLVGYGEATMQLRTIAVNLDPTVIDPNAATFWRSPLLRISLGLSVAVTMGD